MKNSQTISWIVVAAIIASFALLEIAPTTRTIESELCKRTHEVSVPGPAGRVAVFDDDNCAIVAVGEPLYVDVLVGNLADSATVKVVWVKADASLPDMKIGVITDRRDQRYLDDASISNASFSLSDTTTNEGPLEGSLVSTATLGLPYRSRQDGAVRFILGVSGASPDRRFGIDRVTVTTTRPSLLAIARRLFSAYAPHP